jgi:hypothetical protein
MPSKALAALTDRLKDVDQLMAAHRAVAGPKRGRKFEVEGLNRAAVLMLTSHFEGYLEDVMAEAVQAVNPKLSASTLTGGFHNPWPDRIDELFAFLGMVKPSKSISWQRASNTAVRSNLKKLVGTRNKLAHGTTGVTVYKTDVTSLRKYVEGFARRFDALVRAQVKLLTGSNPWPK